MKSKEGRKEGRKEGKEGGKAGGRQGGRKKKRTKETKVVSVSPWKHEKGNYFCKSKREIK